MAEVFKIEEIEEKVILVGVSEQDGDDAEDSVAELAELVKTAGATVVGTMIQKRELIHPGTYIGSGKVAELKLLVEELGATGIVCDDELSPAQLRNLEDMLDTKVMDRTLIILDIFAARATTSEGKDLDVPCQDLEAESVQEVRVRKSWKLTDVLSKTGLHS